MPHCDAPGCQVADEVHKIVMWTTPNGLTRQMSEGCLIWQISALSYALNDTIEVYVERAVKKGIPKGLAMQSAMLIMKNGQQSTEEIDVEFIETSRKVEDAMRRKGKELGQ